MRRRHLIAALPALILAACTNPDDGDTSDYEKGDADTGPAGGTASQTPPHAPGTAAHVIYPDSTTATVTLSEVRQTGAPDGWGDGTYVFATITVVAVAGTPRYDQTAWTIATAGGARIPALTIGTPHGLPARPLGTGTLPAAGRATGLVAFEYGGPLADCTIEHTAVAPPVVWAAG